MMFVAEINLKLKLEFQIFKKLLHFQKVEFVNAIFTRATFSKKVSTFVDGREQALRTLGTRLVQDDPPYFST